MKNMYLLLLISLNALGTDLKTAELRNLQAYDLCAGKMAVENLDDGSVLMNFDHLIARRQDPKPFIKCRISAEFDLPKNYHLSQGSVKATIIGNFTKPGDQIGGRLNVTIASEKNGDLKMDQGCHEDEPHQVQLATQIPLVSATEDNRTISINFLLEAMLNYRLDQPSAVNASLTSMTISPLMLSHSHSEDSHK